MTREEIIDGLGIYTVGRLKKERVHITVEELQNFIDAIEALEQEPRWIPVSERLPENKTYVLTTIKVPNRIAHTRSGWYEGGFFHNDNGDVWRATDMEVIAWMPLPEPYKAESEE